LAPYDVDTGEHFLAKEIAVVLELIVVELSVVLVRDVELSLFFSISSGLVFLVALS